MRRGRIAALMLAVGLLTAGCGTSTTVHRAPPRTAVFSSSHPRARTHFVPRRSGTGRSFLAPSGVPVGSIDVVVPPGEPAGEANFRGGRGGRDDPFGPTLDATINRPDHVEIVAVGRRGELVHLGSGEDCGFIDRGHSWIAGVNAESAVHLPGVVMLTLPRWSRGTDQCQVAVTAAAPRGVRLEIVNY